MSAPNEEEISYKPSIDVQFAILEASIKSLHQKTDAAAGQNERILSTVERIAERVVIVEYKSKEQDGALQRQSSQMSELENEIKLLKQVEIEVGRKIAKVHGITVGVGAIIGMLVVVMNWINRTQIEPIMELPKKVMELQFETRRLDEEIKQSKGKQ